jgi:nicotinamidase-related amidase
MSDHIPASRRSRLLNPDDCVFLLVDMQEKLLPVISENERVLDNIVRLAQFCSILNIPVVVSEQIKLGRTVSQIQEVLPDLEPLEKESFDCLLTPSISDALAKTGRKTLVLAGIEAHVCVLQTALHGLEDYQVHVVSDAASSRSQHNVKAAERRLLQAGAIVSTTEMFIFEALQRAGTEAFKKSYVLIK